MKKFLLILLALPILLVLAGVGLLVWVQQADLSKLAMQQVEKATGLKVEAASLSVKLWPKIEVQASAVRVPAAVGEAPLVTFDSATLRASWGLPLRVWRGMALEELVLVNPTVVAKVDKDGVGNWVVANAAEAAPVAPATQAGSGALDVGAFVSSFGVVKVQNLNLTYADARSGQTTKLTGTDVTLDATDLAKLGLNVEGAVNGQPLKLQARTRAGEGSAVVATETYPVDVAMVLANFKLMAKGTVEPAKQAFDGQIKAESPNLLTTAAAVLGKAPVGVPAEALLVTGQLAGSPERVVLNVFRAELGNLLNATGDVDVRLGATPAANGKVQAQGANLRALVALANPVQAKQLPAESFSVVATFDGQDAVILRDLTAKIGQLVTVRGSGSYVPKGEKVTADVRVEGADAWALGRAFGVAAQLPAEDFGLNAKVAGTMKALSLEDTTLRLGTLVNATVAGTVAPLNVTVSAKGPSTVALAVGLGLATAGVPASAFNVSAKVAGEKTVTLDDLVVDLPGLVQVAGKASWTAGVKPKATADLKLGSLNLNALAADMCAAKAVSKADGGTNVAAAGAKGGGDNPLPATPLAVEGLRGVAFDVTMDAPTVTCDAYQLTTLNVVAKNGAETLNAAVRATLSGQPAKLDVTLGHRGVPTLSTQFELPQLPLEDYVSTLGARGVRLPLTVTGDLRGQGASVRALVGSLSGKVGAKATEGQLPYESLLGNAGQLASLLQGGSAVEQPSGKVDDVTVEMVADGGLLTAKTLTASTDGGAFTLNGVGTVNLKDWTLALTLTPKLRRLGAANDEKALEVPVRVAGSISAPAIGADPAFTGRLGGRLLGEGLKALGVDKELSKGIGGALGGVLGGGEGGGEAVGKLLDKFLPAEAAPAAKPADEAAPKEEPAAAAPATLTPEEAAGELLRGFLGNNN